MPIYEYKCDLCNGLWEEIQKFTDDPITVCKSCEKEGGVHKLVSGKIAAIVKDSAPKEVLPTKSQAENFVKKKMGVKGSVPKEVTNFLTAPWSEIPNSGSHTPK